MNTTETAKKIRTNLKRLGINSKRVSVRKKYAGSIHLTVKDASLSLAFIKEMAEGYQRIDRCEYTGEILAGGNLFIDVQYSSEAEAARIEAVKDAVLAATAEAQSEPNSIIPIEGTKCQVSFDDYCGRFQVWTSESQSWFAGCWKTVARTVIA